MSPVPKRKVKIAIAPSAKESLLPVVGSTFGFASFAGVATLDTVINKLAVVKRSFMSPMTYGIEASPLNPFAGVNVTSPVFGSTTYVPCAFVTVKREQLGAISTSSHKRSEVAFSAYDPGESFAIGLRMTGIKGFVAL